MHLLIYRLCRAFYVLKKYYLEITKPAQILPNATLIPYLHLYIYIYIYMSNISEVRNSNEGVNDNLLLGYPSW